MGNFPGLTTISEGDHEHWQDAVCASHGVHPLVEFLQNRFAVPRRCESAFVVGSRTLSSHGFCAVDLARISSRHRGKPGGKPQQTLWPGVSLPDQEKYACRSQRPHTRISLVTLHDSGKTRPGDELHDLCKQRLASVHGQPPESLSTPGSYPFLAICSSNRHQTKLPLNPHPASFSSFAGII
jgi:hypothetical protein